MFFAPKTFAFLHSQIHSQNAGPHNVTLTYFRPKAQIVAVTMVRSLKRRKASLEIPLTPFRKGGTLSVLLQILKGVH